MNNADLIPSAPVTSEELFGLIEAALPHKFFRLLAQAVADHSSMVETAIAQRCWDRAYSSLDAIARDFELNQVGMVSHGVLLED